MECRGINFPNISKILVFDDINYTTFSFVLKMLLEFVQDTLKRHYKFAEGFFLKSLQKHQNTFSYGEIHHLIQHMHTPLIYGYMFLGGIIMSLLAIPYVCCHRSCKRRMFSVGRYQYCFLVEGFLFIIGTILLAIGIGATWQVSLKLNRILNTSPKETIRLTEDLWFHRLQLESNVKTLNDSVSDVLNRVSATVNNLPENITVAFKNHMRQNLKEAVTNYEKHNVALRNTFNKANILGKKNGSYNIEGALKNLQIYAKNMIDRLKFLQAHNESNENVERVTDELEILQNSIKLISEYKLPNLRTVRGNLYMIINQHVPETYDLFFEESLLEILTSKFTGEQQKFSRQALELKKTAGKAAANVTKSLDAIFPQKTKDGIVKISNNWNDFLSLFKFSRDKHCPWSYGTLWLLLFPALHTSLVLSLLISGCIISIKELKKISNMAHFTPKTKPRRTILLFKLAIWIAISFLWLTLTITEAVFIAHLPLTTFCLPITNEKIFDDYIDNSQVWNNSTWLESKIDEYLPPHHFPLKVRDIFKRCSRNETLYSSLRMNEYWNVGKSFDLLTLDMNTTAFQLNFENAINITSGPNIKTIDAFIAKSRKSEEHLDFKDGTKLNNYVKNMNDIIEEIRQILPRNLELHVNEITHLAANTTMHILKNIHDAQMLRQKLLNVRSAVEDMKDKTKYIAAEHKNIMSREVSWLFLNISEDIRCILNRTMKYIENCIVRENACNILPVTHKFIATKICQEGLYLLTAYWLSLAFTSFSTAACMLLSCRILGYIYKTNNYHYLQWRRRYENEGIYKSTNVMDLMASNLQSSNGAFAFQNPISLQRFEIVS